LDIKEALHIVRQWYSLTAESGPRPHLKDFDYKKLVSQANIGGGSKVLDVGTGNGEAAFEALQAVGSDGYIIGIDNSEGQLKIAHQKLGNLDSTSIDFNLMDMSNLAFSDDSFDHVISSFAIYGSYPSGVGLREAYRVLKKTGNLTFTMLGKPVHGSYYAYQAFRKILEKHRTRQPSEFLKKMRKAFSIAPFGILAYGPLSEPSEPSAVLRFMRSVGFQNVEATITYHRMIYPTVEAFVEYQITGDLEFSEMAEEDKREFRKDCLVALQPLVSDEGLLGGEREVIYYSGCK